MDSTTLSTLKEWMAQGDRAAWLRAHPEHRETLTQFAGLDDAVAVGAKDLCARL